MDMLTWMYSAVEMLPLTLGVTVKDGKIINVPEGWETQTLNVVKVYISRLMSGIFSEGFVTLLSNYTKLLLAAWPNM